MVHRWRWLADLAWDFRMAVRGFRKAPLFTAVIVGSLALAIGATTAVFSAVDALLLRTLPYPHADRLVWLAMDQPDFGISDTVRALPFVRWRDHGRTLDAVAVFDPFEVTLTGEGEPERLPGVGVSGSFFPMLGATFHLGRNFLPEETRHGGEQVVILSHDLWQRRFRADPAIVGRSIRLNQQTDNRVVGVLSPGFRFFGRTGLWLPVRLDGQPTPQLFGRLLQGFGRLAPGVSTVEAMAELQAIKDRPEPELSQPPRSYIDSHVRVTPLHAHLLGGTPRMLVVLQGAAALILAIACANVANLLLARAAARRKETAVLASLGAGRLRLVRQMLTESAVLALAGAAGGVMVAWALVRMLSVSAPRETLGRVALLSPIEIDVRVLALTLAAAVACGLLFGLAPALQFSRPDLAGAMKDGAGVGTVGRQRMKQVLLVSQVALSLVLLVGAGLLLRSFGRLLQVPAGFSADDVLTFRMNLGPRYPDHARRADFQKRAVESLAAIPGVAGAAAITNLPLTGVGEMHLGGIGRDPATGKGGLTEPAVASMVSHGYFRTFDIALRAGRFFDDRDGAEAAPVVIVSHTAARLLWPGDDPIGKSVSGLRPANNSPTVVGVVDDVRHRGLERDIRPHIYVPYTQMSIHGAMTFVVRSTLPSSALVPELRRRIHEIDADQPVHDVKTMDERMAASVAPRRFTMVLLSAFALLAWGLASVGVYGVVAYLVTQRRHEVGIRQALGAEASDIVRLFVRWGLRLGLYGVGLGIAAALGVSRVMTSLLFGVSPFDITTFAGMALALGATVFLACWIPARRATTASPVVALRQP